MELISSNNREDASMSRNFSLFRLSAFSVILLIALAGLASAQQVHITDPPADTGLALTSQSPTGVEIHFGMSSFNLDAVDIHGQTMQKVTMADVFLQNDAGAPDLPGLSRFIAIPEGATATVEIISSRTEIHQNIEIAPAPVIPTENDDSPLVYNMNQAIYGSDSSYPSSAVLISDIQQIRGVDMVTVGITPFQYNPVSKELVVYTELDIRVDFQGGNGSFGEDRLRNRYWEPILSNQLFNYDTLRKPDFNARRDGYGFEYVIIIPDEAEFLAWGDSLKSWRKLQGISTEVFTTSETGTTTNQIESWINNAYNSWDIPPVAFLMLGDYPNSGFRSAGITSPVHDGYCVSDNIYADVDSDHLPDMFHARITAQDSDHLATMINKMFSYEREPYTDPDFYNHPILAGGWQDERWFILCTEIVQGFLANELGKDPVREYAIYSGSPESSWSTNQNTYMLTNYFGPNGLGYIPSTPAHLTDWSSNSTRVNNSINAGAFMLLHRDHGEKTIWGEPDYSIGDIAGLNNEQYPFIFSINCLTGKYDWTSECLVEGFHRSDHAALGVMGATESSYSFVNDTFIFGMVDGMWSEFMPAEAPEVDYSPIALRPAMGMVNGKYFLQGSSWPYNTGDKTVTHHLFHHHGDAFLTMYSEIPQPLTVSHEDICFMNTSEFTVRADLGAVIALTVNGEIIGVADGTGSPLVIPIIPQTEPAELRITVTKANHYRYDVTIPLLPPDGPFLVIDDLIVDDDLAGGTAGNDNGAADAGETVQLMIPLRNVGTDLASDVQATLTTIDPYCTLGNNVTQYGLIMPDQTSNPTGDLFDILIDPNCPNDYQISFVLTVVSSEREDWVKNFSLPVAAPIFDLIDFVIDDTVGGNNNGRIEPGETVQLTATIGNSGGVQATNLTGHLVISHPEVSVPIGQATLLALPAGETAQLSGPFEIEFSADYPAPDLLEPYLAIRSDWSQGRDLPFELSVGGDFFDMESGSDWTHYVVTATFIDNWHLSTARNHTPGGSTSWKFGDTLAGDYASLSDGALETDAITLQGTNALSFYHWMEAETSAMHNGYAYDGGLVEMQIDGGPWQVITPVGGYPYLVRAGGTPGPWAAETPFFSGSHDWQQVTFDLTGISGEVRFRFRFGSDGAATMEGWYIDDVEITGDSDQFSDTENNTPLGLHPILEQNRPNPFGNLTAIRFQLPKRQDVMLRVFDLSGRLVRTLIDDQLAPGSHPTFWDGRDENGEPAGSGVYFYKLETDESIETKKMILAK